MAIVFAAGTALFIVASHRASEEKRRERITLNDARSVAIALDSYRERKRGYPQGVRGSAFLGAIGVNPAWLNVFGGVAARDTVAFPIDARDRSEPIFAGRIGTKLWVAYTDFEVTTHALPPEGFRPGPTSSLAVLRPLVRVGTSR